MNAPQPGVKAMCAVTSHKLLRRYVRYATTFRKRRYAASDRVGSTVMYPRDVRRDFRGSVAAAMSATTRRNHRVQCGRGVTYGNVLTRSARWQKRRYRRVNPAEVRQMPRRRRVRANMNDVVSSRSITSNCWKR